MHLHDFYPEPVKDLHPIGDTEGQIQGLLFARPTRYHRVKLEEPFGLLVDSFDTWQ